MTLTATSPDVMLNALPHPIVSVDEEGHILNANMAAESFFQMSRGVLARYPLSALVTPQAILTDLIADVRERAMPVSKYGLAIDLPRTGGSTTVDIYAAPVNDGSSQIVVLLQERATADKISRQLTHRTAARSAAALSAMLAHEIKNPLSGIRGAAQLLEQSVSSEDGALTRLICDEADRIVKLVDRMEVFTDERPLEREPVNVHAILEHVRILAQSGCARGIRIVEEYDPSLPLVLVNRDQMVQVMLNLIKNAAEALSDQENGEIHISTAFRSGIRMAVPGGGERISLPLEIGVRDNGPGIPDDMLPFLFDPFITSKPSGSGLGLALVAKIIKDHGGLVECVRQPRGTLFRLLLPIASDVGE
jgi:two-component system, NtrC family, nitrogen regulation sensor histidine kinase GlnL